MGIKPISAKAHLTGIGLDSKNNVLCNKANWLLIACALYSSPARAAVHIAFINAGATLAVTDMTPCPPARIKSTVLASSPV